MGHLRPLVWRHVSFEGAVLFAFVFIRRFRLLEMRVGVRILLLGFIASVMKVCFTGGDVFPFPLPFPPG